MAFFTSSSQEVYEHRLKRSTSLTSVRARSRQASGTPKSPPPSRIHTHARLLTTESNNASPPLVPSPTPSSIPSVVPATPKSNELDHDLASSSKLPQGPVLRRDSPSRHDDSRSLREPVSVHDPEPGQRRQRLDTSSPSALPSHSRRDFKSGSFSDSGLTPRTPHSPRRSNLSSHSPHLSLLHARHHSPSSPNLPIASYFSDGDRSPNLLQPSRLDVKRLLSKPAAPSVNSTLSITSDSESNALPRTRTKEAWPSKTRMQVHFQTPPTESTEQLPTSPPPSIQQRPRNLLRKRSASKQNRATVSVTLPDKTTSATALQPTIRSPTTSSRSEFSTTTLQFVIASRAAVPVSATSHGSSSKLTPAGAIAQAYKEQDLRREALAAAARAENLSTAVTASGSRIGVPDPPANDASVASNGRPYHTVYGSSSDSIVIVGSVEDKSFDAGSGSNSNSASTASASQPIKSLTRKVSARFRRGRPSVSKEAGHGDEGGGERERPMSEVPSSQRERQWSAKSPRVNKFEPLRLSFDQRSVVSPFAGLAEPLEVRSPRPMRSESKPDVVDHPSPTPSKGKQKQREDDSGAGGRLWRLVKRISAGGLRERFQTTSEPAPPVPPIPSDLVPSRATLEVKMPVSPIGGSRSGITEPGGTGDYVAPTVGYFMDSTSAVRCNPDAPPPITCGTPSEIPTTPQGPSPKSQPKIPSISSSSPQSSEPTSTNFFRSHSSRSSFSSMFCGSPPPPSPSAFAQTSSPRSRSRAKSISSSAPPTRPSFDGSQQTSKSPRAPRPRKRSSPDIPAFSVSEVINNFIVRRPSLVRRASNTRRQQQQQQQQNAPARSTATTPQPEETNMPPPRPARSDLRNAMGQPMQSPGPSVQSNDSHSSSSTERAGSASASTISAHAVAGSSASAAVTRLTFRELGGTQKQAWTSQEKEDKWDDLLKKSARAGGTLHLDADSAGLASDNMRFSSSTLE